MSPTAADSKAHQNGKSAFDSQDLFQPWFEMYRKWTEEGVATVQKVMEQTQTVNPMMGTPDLYKVWLDSYQAFAEKMGQESWPNPADPESYKKMYETWLESCSKNIETYMRTDEFAAKSGKDLEQFSDYKKKLGQAFEIYWESVHLPSTADMQEVYQKLYTVDRKLDELDKRFRNIEKLLEKQFSTSKTSNKNI